MDESIRDTLGLSFGIHISRFNVYPMECEAELPIAVTGDWVDNTLPLSHLNQLDRQLRFSAVARAPGECLGRI